MFSVTPKNALILVVKAAFVTFRSRLTGTYSLLSLAKAHCVRGPVFTEHVSAMMSASARMGTLESSAAQSAHSVTADLNAPSDFSVPTAPPAIIALVTTTAKNASQGILEAHAILIID